VTGTGVRTVVGAVKVTGVGIGTGIEGTWTGTGTGIGIEAKPQKKRKIYRMNSYRAPWKERPPRKGDEESDEKWVEMWNSMAGDDGLGAWVPKLVCIW
jgi:hypothetical protein